MDAVLANITKSQEGIAAGLGAVAEFLTKQYDKEEERKEAEALKVADEEEKEKEELEKQSLVKAVTDAVMKQITNPAVLKQLQNLHGDTAFKVSGKDTWPMSSRPAAEDKETTAKLRNETEEVQKPIQAMQKQSPVEEVAPELDDDVHPEECRCENCPKGIAVKASEFPKEEDKFPKQEAEYPEDMRAMLKNLQKQNSVLTKELINLKKSQDTLVKSSVKGALEKVGFREEKNVSGVRLLKSTLGVTEMDIKKSEDPKVKDPLDSYYAFGEQTHGADTISWKEIADAKLKEVYGAQIFGGIETLSQGGSN